MLSCLRTRAGISRLPQRPTMTTTITPLRFMDVTVATDVTNAVDIARCVAIAIEWAAYGKAVPQRHSPASARIADGRATPPRRANALAARCPAGSRAFRPPVDWRRSPAGYWPPPAAG